MLVSGFYDDVPPLSHEEREILAAVPDRTDELKRFFGIGRTEQVGDNLQEALQFPSLNIRGLQSGDIGDQARTIIPDRATAEIDVRLVKETDPERMLQRVLTHIRAQGFHVLDRRGARRRDARALSAHRPHQPRQLDQGVPHRNDAARIDRRSSARSSARGESRRSATGRWGAPCPIDFFIQALGMPAIGVPVVNFDNNQHSNNENICGYRTSGMPSSSFAAVLQM